MTEHNHITRDIKPFGGTCQACDEYHARRGVARIEEGATGALKYIYDLRRTILLALERLDDDDDAYTILRMGLDAATVEWWKGP